MKHRGETNFYLCEINRDMVIDATYKGNKSRYINHSCCPNTEMQKWFITNFFICMMMLQQDLDISCNTCIFPHFLRIIDGETRIGIFATRDIQKGEHLTYDYQYEHFPVSLLYTPFKFWCCWFLLSYASMTLAGW